MKRTVQVACPQCQTKLRITTQAQTMVQVSCVHCGKRFSARLPAAAAFTAAPAHDADPAFWDELPASSAPATQPPLSPLARPAAAVEPRPWKAAAPRPKSGRSAKRLIWPAAILAGLLALAPVFWLASRAVDVVRETADAVSEEGWTGLSSISLTPDSHEKVIADFLRLQEESFEQSSTSAAIDDAYIEESRQRAVALKRRSMKLLIRAVMLGEASEEQKQDLEQRLTALRERYRQRIIDRAASLSEADQKRLAAIVPQDEAKSLQLHTLAAVGYLTEGMYPLPESDSKREQLYREELLLVREMIKVLAAVSSEDDLPVAGEQLEALADRMLEVAVAHSKLGMGMGLVDRRFVREDEVSKVVLLALHDRIQSEMGPDESFDQGFEHFKLARRMTDYAGGSSEASLRKELADARGQHTQPPEPPPALAQRGETAAVAKPKPVAAAQDQPPQVPAAAEPAAGQGEPATAQTQAAGQPDTAPAEERAPPGFGNRGPARLPLRPQERFGRNRRQASEPADRSSPQRPGPTAPGLDSRGDFAALRARFEGPGSAKLLFQTTDDSRQQCERLVANLGITDYLIHSSNGQTTLLMKFDGPLQQLEKAIDFGTVTWRDDVLRVMQLQLH